MTSWDAERLPIWVIYDHPDDFPNVYVARLHFSLPQPEPSAICLTCTALEPLRRFLEHRGCFPMDRHPDDDPAILETWME